MYSFGSLVPNRHSATADYRYGFQNQEKDDEIKGEGNSLNYTFRMHDPRAGRFFATDPLAPKYPHNSPYAFSENSVIAFVELEGLEKAGPAYIKNNVHYITLFKPWVSPVLREGGKTFTETALNKNTAKKIEYTINAQQYEHTDPNESGYPITGPAKTSEYESQGYTIQNKKIIEGRSSEGTFYFGINGDNQVSFRAGDPPTDSKLAIGGGIPIIINGLPYGEKNEYKKGSPNNLPSTGSVDEKDKKYLTTKSSKGYKPQNVIDKGKSILAYNSRTNSILLIVQENGVNGMTLDQIKSDLIKRGYNNAISFDGSSSATLIKDDKIIVDPAFYKDNSIPSGIQFSVEKK